MNVLVLGAGGQLGQCFKNIKTDTQKIKYIFADRNTLDICDKEQLSRYIQDYKIDVIANCAAYTAVDRAEQEIQKAIDINTKAVRNMALLCKEHDISLIHYSTDYVYNIAVDRPLSETDDCRPNGIYAQSKHDGELAILNVQPNALIIRTSWVYSEYGHNFVKTMLRLFDSMKELKVVNDQIGSPTYAQDLANASHSIIEQTRNHKKIDGVQIYNYSNNGVTNWASFAQTIADIKQKSIRIHPIPTEAYPTPAHRPRWSVMSKNKIVTDFGIDIPDWKESLEICLSKM